MRGIRKFLPALAGAAALTTASAAAQVDPPEARRLNEVERDIKRGESERDRLFQAQLATTRDLENIRMTLVKIARDIQDQEYSMLVLENRLADMEKEEAALTARLSARDVQLGQVLMALERLALNPGDALSLSPLRPADAVRTALLLRTAVPAVRASAQTLQVELSDLYVVRADMTAQREIIALGAGELVDKRRELEAIERTRTERQVALASATSEATVRLEQLAREAQDLRELVDKLNADRRQRQAEEERQKAEAAKQAAERKAAEAERAAKAPPDSSVTPEPTAAPELDLAPLVAELRPFSEARGTLPFPVIGSIDQRYGEADGGAGLRSKGITIKTRPAAQVVAPFDGVVAFAGPFRAYGLLLIIEHSEGYHTLLAGLGRVDCAVGQRVLAGEPVGSMDVEGSPSLYVELRRDGQPMNPLPWLASRTGKSSG